jgi:hypothetical protein
MKYIGKIYQIDEQQLYTYSLERFLIHHAILFYLLNIRVER